MSFSVEARNNLKIPIRLTVTALNKIVNRTAPQILITIGEKGTSLKNFYLTCIDVDLPPKQEEWEKVGVLEVLSDPKISIKGAARGG